MKLAQLAKDPAPMPKSVTKPDGATKSKTEDGDWRGNNEYYQAKQNADFAKLDAIEGHRQEKNVEL